MRRWECRDMHVKIDEDLPKSVVDLLRAEGYQATSVREQGLQGMKDSALWQVVQQDGASSLRDKRCSLAGFSGATRCCYSARAARAPCCSVRKPCTGSATRLADAVAATVSSCRSLRR